jgi:hypothetical protein
LGNGIIFATYLYVMNYSDKKAFAVAIAFIFALAMSGCSFDPWPEPDPGQPSADNDVDGGSDTDDDETGGDEGTDDEANFGDESAIFCSAPNPDGIVTVVGTPGAAESGEVVLVTGENGQIESFVLSDDGGFAGRIEALAGEVLAFTILGGEGLSEAVTVPAGDSESGSVGDAIVGPGAGAAPSNDASGDVAIQGEGDALQAGLVVIGGNIDMSLGRSAVVSCFTQCQFELSIPGAAGDEIDLFLVRESENSGITDSQTEIVPE